MDYRVLESIGDFSQEARSLSEIAEVLFKSSFLESWGSGVGRMVDACRAQGVPEPG